METLLLTCADTRRIVDQIGLDALMDALLERLSTAFLGHDPERSVVPPRDGFDYEDPAPGLIEWMPSLDLGRKVTVKTVGYHPSNPIARNVPTIISTLACYDTMTGHLIGLADSTFLTALRTGAASAIASRVLARDDSSCVGLIGCGAQAVTQLHALSRVFPIQTVLVKDVNVAVESSFAERVAGLLPRGVTVRSVPTQEIVRDADIICTCTSVEVGAGPVFDDAEQKAWLHINAVGSDFPGKTEVPLSVLRRALVCPDFLEQALKEGECQQLSSEETGPSVVHLVQHADDYQGWKEKPTVFDSTGWALEDEVAMELLLDHAAQLGVGTTVQIEAVGGDPYNPYDLRAEGAGQVSEPAAGSGAAVEASLVTDESGAGSQLRRV